MKFNKIIKAAESGSGNTAAQQQIIGSTTAAHGKRPAVGQTPQTTPNKPRPPCRQQLCYNYSPK
jgi:hypothetical protein